MLQSCKAKQVNEGVPAVARVFDAVYCGEKYVIVIASTHTVLWKFIKQHFVKGVMNVLASYCDN